MSRRYNEPETDADRAFEACIKAVSEGQPVKIRLSKSGFQRQGKNSMYVARVGWFKWDETLERWVSDEGLTQAESTADQSGNPIETRAIAEGSECLRSRLPLWSALLRFVARFWQKFGTDEHRKQVPDCSRLAAYPPDSPTSTRGGSQ